MGWAASLHVVNAVYMGVLQYLAEPLAWQPELLGFSEST